MIQEVVLGRNKEELEVKKYSVYMGNNGYLKLSPIYQAPIKSEAQSSL